MKRGRDGGKKRTGAGSGSRKPAAPRALAGTSKTASKTASKAHAAPKSKPAPSAAKAATKSAKPIRPVARDGKVARPATKPAAVPPKAAGGRNAAKPAANVKGPVRPVAPMPVVKALPKVEAPPKFRREYRKWLARLIALRQRLRDEGSRLEEEGLKALEQEVSVDHMADYGSDSYEQDTTLALIENKSEALRDVDEAIRRIEAKTYGLCENCEQLVPGGRLEVLPHARYCVKCQAAREGVGP